MHTPLTYDRQPMARFDTKIDYLDDSPQHERLQHHHRDAATALFLSEQLGDRLPAEARGSSIIFFLFKLHRAYNKMSRLPPATLRQIVAASAGSRASMSSWRRSGWWRARLILDAVTDADQGRLRCRWARSSCSRATTTTTRTPRRYDQVRHRELTSSILDDRHDRRTRGRSRWRSCGGCAIRSTRSRRRRGRRTDRRDRRVREAPGRIRIVGVEQRYERDGSLRQASRSPTSGFANSVASASASRPRPEKSSTVVLVKPTLCTTMKDIFEDLPGTSARRTLGGRAKKWSTKKVDGPQPRHRPCPART